MKSQNILLEGEEFKAGISRLLEFNEETSRIENGYIVLCTNGSAEITVNLQRCILSRNCMMVLFHGDMISLTHRTEEFKVQFVAMNQEFLKEACIKLENVVYQILHENFHVIIDDETKATRFSRVLNTLQFIYEDRESIVRRELFLLQARCIFLGIYDIGSRNNKKISTEIDFSSPRALQLFKQFMSLVIDYSRSNREVKFYANKLCITPKYLNTIVKQAGSTTAKSIIDNRVIMQIKIVLKTTDKSIQQVSDEFKFPNQSFFGRYFNKHTGMSPSEFRKKENYM